jgi:hypothetical protein
MTGHTATPRHPNTLHAIACAWSLRRARQQLDDVADREAAQRRTDAITTAAAANIQAWRPMTGRSPGGHGDPVGRTILGSIDAATRDIPAGWAGKLAASTTDTLRWLADQMTPLAAGDPLDRLRNALPDMQPGTAGTVTGWLAGLDKEIRTALHLDPDEHVLPGAQCPKCERRPLYVRTAAPDPVDWVVTCGTECRCSGQGCGCGMLVQVEGAVHIWDSASQAGGRVLAACPGFWSEAA